MERKYLHRYVQLMSQHTTHNTTDDCVLHQKTKKLSIQNATIQMIHIKWKF